jgi:hypothetical protein
MTSAVASRAMARASARHRAPSVEMSCSPASQTTVGSAPTLAPEFDWRLRRTKNRPGPWNFPDLRPNRLRPGPPCSPAITTRRLVRGDRRRAYAGQGAGQVIRVVQPAIPSPNQGGAHIKDMAQQALVQVPTPGCALRRGRPGRLSSSTRQSKSACTSEERSAPFKPHSSPQALHGCYRQVRGRAGNGT